MDERTTGAVRVTHRYGQPAERVFDAWLDPARARRWLFATPGGEIVRADVDARVGGRFAIVDRRGGEDVEHVGTYVEIDRPRRLAFRFAVPKFSPLETQVTVDIVAVPGGCELTLTQEGVLPEYVERTRAGWTTLLQSLDT